MAAQLDIVIPVYNEGGNILATLARAGARGEDAGARADLLRSAGRRHAARGRGNPRKLMPDCRSSSCATTARGAHAAVMAGFAASTAPLIVVYPADDDFNAGILDRMVAKARAGLRHRLRQPLHAGRHA